MSHFFSLVKKELHVYLHSLLAYIFLIVFLALLSWLFFQNFFLVGQASLRGYFAFLPWFLLFLVPTLSMRTWSDEKKTGTLETLTTLPYPRWQLVLAKFTAGAGFLLLVLAFSLPLPIVVGQLGDLDVGQVIAAYFAAWLLSCALFALGMWFSSLTQNAIIAFILTIAGGFLLIVFGISSFTLSSSWLSELASHFSLLAHYSNMARGVLDLRDVIYFAAVIFGCLYLNSHTLASRHWK